MGSGCKTLVYHSEVSGLVLAPGRGFGSLGVWAPGLKVQSLELRAYRVQG